MQRLGVSSPNEREQLEMSKMSSLKETYRQEHWGRAGRLSFD
jgi:hypothetical protein